MLRYAAIIILILLQAAGAALRAESSAEPVEPTRVFVIDIDDEIGSYTWQRVRQGLQEARKLPADLLLVHLNTYGGAVDAADSIRTALLHFPIPTVAFVDNNAASAGALIALACDSVYMRPDATMGAVTVVNGLDGAAMPDKYQSYMRAMMRATAESHGRVSAAPTDSAAAAGDSVQSRWRRDPLIAEAMVDPRVAVPGLIDSTKVLTFTASEALHWGFSDGYAESIPAVCEQLDVANPEITTYHDSWLDWIIGFLTHPAVKAALISIIMMGIYFEFQMPGVGFPAAAALTAAVLYFLPVFFGHTMSPWVAILFGIGVILIIFEVLVIPGFGLAGIGGICAIAVALFWGMLDSYTPEEGTETVTSTMVWSAVGWFVGAMVVAVGIAAWLTSRSGPRWVRRVTELDRSLSREDGYVGVDMSASRHVGREAVAATDLRPGGKVIIDGELFDAVSASGAFIEAGTRVKVVRHSGAQLYVN